MERLALLTGHEAAVAAKEERLKIQRMAIEELNQMGLASSMVRGVMCAFSAIRTALMVGENECIIPVPEVAAAAGASTGSVVSTDRIQVYLERLGYKVSPSYSSNPANETWTIKAKEIK